MRSFLPRTIILLTRLAGFNHNLRHGKWHADSVLFQESKTRPAPWCKSACQVLSHHTSLTPSTDVTKDFSCIIHSHRHSPASALSIELITQILTYESSVRTLHKDTHLLPPPHIVYHPTQPLGTHTNHSQRPASNQPNSPPIIGRGGPPSSGPIGPLMGGIPRPCGTIIC